VVTMTASSEPDASSDAVDFEVIIIGTGFSGLLCAAYLKEAGIGPVRMFEKSQAVGGVWSRGGVGAYPGAACDVQAYTYLPFLDRTGFIPSRKYVGQREISEYAELLTDHVGVRDQIQFSREVVEVRYRQGAGTRWQIRTVDASNGERAEVVTCHHVVAANGPISTPRMPELPGMERFQGESFHTARWDARAVLSGKRVGVVGTGASAAQVITAIADDVKSLHVFQRTPTWCVRRDDQPTPPEMIEKFRAGGYGEELRYVDWKGERPPPDAPFTFDDLHDERRNGQICEFLRGLIRKDVKDPELAKRLTPDYPFFCKRALFIDDYYTTFNKPHVTLVDDGGGVVAVDETGLTIARGEHYELDVIIYATGFHTQLIPFPVIGRGGVDLATLFGASAANNHQLTRPRSLWGIHVREMPNLYLMVGPQSLNPVTNVTVLAEARAIHIRDLLLKMRDRGHRQVEPTERAVSQWTALCDASADGKVWQRCNNWYLKSTKTDEQAGRERSVAMWMHQHAEYMRHLVGEKGGTQDELLELS